VPQGLAILALVAILLVGELVSVIVNEVAVLFIAEEEETVAEDQVRELHRRRELMRIDAERQEYYGDNLAPVETHSIIMAVFVCGLLACCLVILAALFSERLTQAILDARHDAIQWLVAYWQGH
jgi:hypothetical protein